MLIVFNLIVILLTLGVAYLWATRGLFSAFLHLVCTLVAGAIAFAAWEPLGYMLLDALPSSGFLRFLQGLSWTIALVAPFTVSLIVLRVIVDRIAPNNTKQLAVVDLVGGGACGLIASMIAMGFLVLGVSYARLSIGLTGYKPLWYSADKSTAGGSLVRSDKLWLPVDRFTAGLYSRLSGSSLATGEPLAKWHPDLTLAGFGARISPGDNQARNVLTSKDFKLLRSYTVGNTQSGSPVRDLLEYETGGKSISQPYTDVNGDAVSSGYLAGYVIEFAPGAKEDSKGGQVIVSNGQVSLICKKAGADAKPNETIAVYPVAVISQARAEDGNLFGRWRFDAEEVFIASVGGASVVNMAFEYVVPAGYEPIALRVKNNRLELSDAPQAGKPKAYTTPTQRDTAIASGSLISGGADIQIDESESVIVDGSTVGATMNREPEPPGVAITEFLGYTLTRQTARQGLVVEKLGRTNAIVGGQGCFSREELSEGRTTTERDFRVERFGSAADQVIVQIVADQETMPASFLGPVMRTLDTNLPLRLIDTDGNVYDAIGYVYEDGDGACIRLTPPDPLNGSGDVPKTISSARTDQKLRLLFLVSKGADIAYYTVGDKALIKFEPPFSTK
ncbi:MAG: CvpA family protein [Phycisphaerales bacterium]